MGTSPTKRENEVPRQEHSLGLQMNNSNPFSPILDQIQQSILDDIRNVVRTELNRSELSASPGSESPPFGWISNEKAQSLLNLSRSTLARLRKSGQLPYSHFGSQRNVFYKIEDIESILNESLRKGPGFSV